MNSLLSSLVIACYVFELISSNFEIEASKTKKMPRFNFQSISSVSIRSVLFMLLSLLMFNTFGQQKTDHPWYKIDWMEIECESVGLTYSEMLGEGRWVIGWDTCHSGYTLETCPLEYVLKKTEELAEEAEEAWG